MANSITTQASHARSLQLGINAIADSTYKEYEAQCDKIFNTEMSDRAYEIDVSESPTGLASLKPEGTATGYDGSKQDFVTTYTHAVYSLGCIITMEAQMNNKMVDLQQKTGTMIKRSLVHSHEQLAANVINNAYSNNIGDGVPLASNYHVLGKGGTFSNRFTVFTPLSQAALEDAQTALEDYRDGSGLLVQVKGVSLHIPRQLRWTAERILKSTGEPNTANTATYNTTQNAMPFHVNTRFTSASEWFVKTDVDHGFKIFDRMGYTFSEDNDFGTENFRTKGMFYRSYGATNPRCAYFSGQ